MPLYLFILLDPLLICAIFEHPLKYGKEPQHVAICRMNVRLFESLDIFAGFLLSGTWCIVHDPDAIAFTHAFGDHIFTFKPYASVDIMVSVIVAKAHDTTGSCPLWWDYITFIIPFFQIDFLCEGCSLTPDSCDAQPVRRLLSFTEL